MESRKDSQMNDTGITFSTEQRQQYRDEGWILLPSALQRDLVNDLRDECDRQVVNMDEEMDRQGVSSIGITHRDSRYFIANIWRDNQTLIRTIFNDTMAEICRATLGSEALLFHEQFVVKCPGGGMKFSWHQDSGYIGHEHRPYLTCWIALDDVDESNGTVRVLPFSRAGTHQRVEHRVEDGSNDKVGYFGDDLGEPIIAPAGSIAVFSSVTFHTSGQNGSNRPRRAYIAQYSAEPVMSDDGTKHWNNAVPFIKDGKRVDGLVEQ
jgi:ectoine hydroxylase-related dioxygenase (phytanoyl-CoA dioxygenase family)